MARRKHPCIPDARLDQLLDGADPRTAFNPDGVLDVLKNALAERMRMNCVGQPRSPSLRLRGLRRLAKADSRPASLTVIMSMSSSGCRPAAKNAAMAHAPVMSPKLRDRPSRAAVTPRLSLPESCITTVAFAN